MTADGLQKQIQKSQPDLIVLQRPEGFSIGGMFRISDSQGAIDEFNIKIFLSKRFPIEWPRVWEVSKRLPIQEDRHVNPVDGTICYLTPEDYYLWCARSTPTLLAFLDGPLRDYFLSQIYFEENRSWLFGERGHGEIGRIDFYGDLFGLTDFVEIHHNFIKLKGRKLKGHISCTCGSQKQIRHCHSDILIVQKNFPDGILREASDSFDKIILAIKQRLVIDRSVRSSVVDNLRKVKASF